MPFDDDPPSTPASQALRAWHATLIEATRSGVRPAQGVFIQAMPPLAASARAHDFRAAEWKIVDIAGEIHAQEQDYWSARAYFSPEQTHCALLFAGPDAWEGGAVVWVDGESVPVPRAVDGSSRLDDWGWWLSERYFAVWLGGFYQHPHARICIDALGLGNIRGHWVYDTQTRTAQCIVPDDAQAWEKPRAKIVGNDLVIYADLEDKRAGREARRVRL
ncbi:hypothetical protein ABFV80_001339 [Vandammella animalimorsus]|uniref:hypothetical protein n=1 Tax=Vandammella animalimorsus TaxID=2029117 RepID=UPI00325BA561